MYSVLGSVMPFAKVSDRSTSVLGIGRPREFRTVTVTFDKLYVQGAAAPVAQLVLVGSIVMVEPSGAVFPSPQALKSRSAIASATSCCLFIIFCRAAMPVEQCGKAEGSRGTILWQGFLR